VVRLGFIPAACLASALTHDRTLQPAFAPDYMRHSFQWPMRGYCRLRPRASLDSSQEKRSPLKHATRPTSGSAITTPTRDAPYKSREIGGLVNRAQPPLAALTDAFQTPSTEQAQDGSQLNTSSAASDFRCSQAGDTGLNSTLKTAVVHARLTRTAAAAWPDWSGDRH